MPTSNGGHTDVHAKSYGGYADSYNQSHRGYADPHSDCIGYGHSHQQRDLGAFSDADENADARWPLGGILARSDEAAFGVLRGLCG